MKKNSIRIALFLVFAFVFVLFFYIFPYYHIKNNGCDLHQQIYLQKIKSEVKKKFIDTHNHAMPKIIYLDADGRESELIFTGEFKEMYDSLNIGDSIFKEKGSLNYKVKSNTVGKLKSFKFHTLCKDSIR